MRFVLAQRADGEASLPLGLDRYPEEWFRRVEIGPLSLGAVSALVTGRLGTALARPTLRRLHETANGNAFFALELARALVRIGGRVEPGEALPVPSSLDELLAARLVALPPATQAALLPIAALREPTLQLVSDALEIADPSVRLQPAVDAHLIQVERPVVRFAHPLLAAAVYARAHPQARRDTHRALARVAPTVEERARHLALASEPPDDDVANELDVAARTAVAHGSPATAAELSELAARFTGQDLADEQRRRLCDAADFHLRAGDAGRACPVAAPISATAPAGVHRAMALFVLAFADSDPKRGFAQLEQAAAEAAGANELAAQINLIMCLLAIVFRSIEEGRAYAQRVPALAESDAVRAQSIALLTLIDLLAGAQCGDDALISAGGM